MEVIEGIIEEIIYRNEDNGYTVLSIATDEEEITCVGTLFNIAIGEEIHVTGKYVSHHVYGEQFQVEEFQSFMPRELKAMERYIGSGAIKGIGPALAKRIIERFEKDTFNVMEQEPYKLSEVKGISEKKAQEIAGIFLEQKQMRQAIIFLQDFGVSLNFAIKIYKEYTDRTLEVIKANPYKLAEDIQGIGFKMSDEIADRIGIDKLSLHRIKAGIRYILMEAAGEGHLFLEKDRLLRYTERLLNVHVLNIENALIELQLGNIVYTDYREDEEIIYLMIYYNMEQYVANKLTDLSLIKVSEDNNIINEIHSLEKDMAIEFDTYQKEAIISAMNTTVLVITGGPGTGKTTTINAIIDSFVNRGMEVFLAAPTGRAAKRMTETTGREAKTIHRLLEIAFSKDELHQRFERNEEYPLECDVLIIDEASMIDITLMYHLLKAVVEGTRVIIVGDKDQLPSVGPGNVLKDIINCNNIHTVILKEIFRQAKESDIVVNAHRINEGNGILIRDNKKDFFFINRKNSNQALSEIISLVKTRLPKFAKVNRIEGIQVLTPMRKGVLGAHNLNIELQKALNPISKSKKEKEYRKYIFRENDKVMQIKNNYNIRWEIRNQFNYVVEEGTGVFNGDIGQIIEINHYNEKLKVKFDDDRIVEYDFSNLDELEIAYATTIHKSQGSEYPVVVLPVFQGPPMLITRNLLYTAITRAKNYVVIVGAKDIIDMMISNNREINRNSLLDRRLDESYDLRMNG